MADNTMLLTRNWVRYTSSKYKFSVFYPRDWELNISDDFPYPRINIYPASINLTGTYSIYTKYTTNVSIFPMGVPIRMALGKTKKSHPHLGIPVREARDYILENGDKWASIIYLKKEPDPWSKSGFIWAQTGIKDHSIKCIRENKEIPPEECDTSIGDEIIHSGFIDKDKIKTEIMILRSIKFTD